MRTRLAHAGGEVLVQLRRNGAPVYFRLPALCGLYPYFPVSFTRALYESALRANGWAAYWGLRRAGCCGRAPCPVPVNLNIVLIL